MRRSLKSLAPPIIIIRERASTENSLLDQSDISKDYDYEAVIVSATDELSLIGHFQMGRAVESRGNTLIYTPKKRPTDERSLQNSASTSPILIVSRDSKNVACALSLPIKQSCVDTAGNEICTYQTVTLSSSCKSATFKKPVDRKSASQNLSLLSNSSARNERIVKRKSSRNIVLSPYVEAYSITDGSLNRSTVQPTLKLKV